MEYYTFSQFYSWNHKTAEDEDEIQAIQCASDMVTQQIVPNLKIFLIIEK